MKESKIIDLIEKTVCLEEELNKSSVNNKKSKKFNIVKWIMFVLIFSPILFLNNSFSNIKDYDLLNSIQKLNMLDLFFLNIDIAILILSLISIILYIILINKNKNHKLNRIVILQMMKFNKKYKKNRLEGNKTIKKAIKDRNKIKKEILENKRNIKILELDIDESLVQKKVLKQIVSGQLKHSISYWEKRLDLNQESLDIIQKIKIKK